MADFSGIQATPWLRGVVGCFRALALAGPLLVAGPAGWAAESGHGGGHGETKPAAPEPPPPPEKPPPPPLPKLEKVETVPRIPKVFADPLTGLALGGLDPVAFFTNGRPIEGRQELELDWRGAAWRFANEGNQAAFRDAPEIYAPRFSGYCAFQLGRGFLAEAAPNIWVIYRDRLYLFLSPAQRAAFMLDPDGAVAKAEAAWPALSRQLP